MGAELGTLPRVGAPPLRTFIEVLRDNCVYSDHAHVFVRMDGSERRVSYPDLWGYALQRAHRLHELGLQKGDRVALILPEPDSFVLSFIGCLTGGIVPVPMYPPLTLAKLEAYGETVRHILQASGAKVLVTVPGLRDMLALHGVVDTEGGLRIITDDELAGEPMRRVEPPCRVELEDLAFLQFTSGSTRKPKGVMVTHRNLSVNAHAIMFDGLRSTPADKGVSWLPLFHDMGLIGFVIAPVFAQVQVMFLPTMSFIRRPGTWLDAIHRFRGTITFAPNFAYALSVRAVKESQSQDWDLSCLKALGCGAEPIQPDVVRGFLQRFGQNGMRPQAILPCYGLAEATLAVTFVGLDETLATDRVDAESMKKGYAQPWRLNGATALELVSCGRPFPGHELRIADDHGRALPERVVGHVLLRGPSVTGGYFEAPEETAEVFKDGWLWTGDLGYLAGGELYVCGRAKDLIIVHGKNYYPHDVERIASEVHGVRMDQCVAFARSGPDGEECVVVCEAQGSESDIEAIDRGIKQRVRAELGVPVAEVVLIKRNAMPKTSSGKVRRRETKQRLEAGTLELATAEQRRRTVPSARRSSPAVV
jgi:fatty-acyl-CoA synthase